MVYEFVWRRDWFRILYTYVCARARARVKSTAIGKPPPTIHSPGRPHSMSVNSVCVPTCPREKRSRRVRILYRIEFYSSRDGLLCTRSLLVRTDCFRRKCTKPSFASFQKAEAIASHCPRRYRLPRSTNNECRTNDMPYYLRFQSFERIITRDCTGFSNRPSHFGIKHAGWKTFPPPSVLTLSL